MNTNKERVLERYRDAWADDSGEFCQIMSSRGHWARVLGYGTNPEEAWLRAAIELGIADTLEGHPVKKKG